MRPARTTRTVTSKTLTALALTALLLTGCTKDDMTLQERAEARATEARAHIDDLADRIGANPRIVEDDIGGCEIGQNDSGLDLIYFVHIDIEPGAVERLQNEIADHYAAEGWTVKHDRPDTDLGTVSASFAKDTFTMFTNLSESTGWAAVGGSGGCVR